MRVYIVAFCCTLIAGLSLVDAQTVRREDVPKYLKQLQTASSAKDRAVAADRLGKRGSINVKDVEDAIEPLKKSVLKDVDPTVRKAAATALGSIAPKAEDTVPILIEALKNDKSKDVKLAVLESLGRYGADAKEALPAIRDFAKDFDKKSQESQLVRTVTMAIVGKKK